MYSTILLTEGLKNSSIATKIHFKVNIISVKIKKKKFYNILKCLVHHKNSSEHHSFGTLHIAHLVEAHIGYFDFEY